MPPDARDVLERLLRERVEELRLEHFHWIRLSEGTASARFLADFTKVQIDRCRDREPFETLTRLALLTAESDELNARAESFRNEDAPSGIWLMTAYLAWADLIAQASLDAR